MCGIAGIFSVSSWNREEMTVAAARMTAALIHRGPDDEGYWYDDAGCLALGHRRLAIIDLSADGRQPMMSQCGRLVIVFNGEIYNYLELRDLLVREDVVFRGHSDTEVLLEAICRWGLDKSLDRVVGMFAFALWNKREHSLILARDRAGKKPLYYLATSRTLYFASEIKSFKALGDVGLSVNPDAVYQYLTFGYVPAPGTIYREIKEIPAGHYVVFGKDLASAERRYWSLSRGKKYQQISFEDAVDETEKLLMDAVKIRLRSDVPVGCFLSGGVDSGLLTAFAARQMDCKLQTFTVSLTDGVFDEGPGAALVARRYDTDHHVLTINPDIRELLPKLVAAYDEPFADASAVPSLCIAAEARKYVKVVINGEGGDELFCGYRRQLAMKLFEQFGLLFRFIPRAFFSFLNDILPLPTDFRTGYAFAHRYLRGLDKNPYERYIAWCVDGFDEREKEDLYRQLPAERVPSPTILAGKATGDDAGSPFTQFMTWDFFLNMHDDMLVKMDIATMAHGLEGRNPFLDHRLIEWTFGLPSSLLLKGYKTKPVLRTLAARYLPTEISQAPKRGFEIPLIKWLREDLHDLVYDSCFSKGNIVLDLFERPYLERLLEEKLPLDPDRWSKRVWILFMLSLWGNINENRIFLS